MYFQRKYNTAITTGTKQAIRIPMVKAGSRDLATNTDWTPASGDVKVSKDGGTEANINTLPTYVNGAWEFIFTATELSCGILTVRVVDSAVKAVEDQFFGIETFGNASAQFQHDPTNSTTFGLTGVPASLVDMTAGGAAKFLSVATGSSDLDAANAQSVAKLIVANVPQAAGIASSVWAAGTRTLSAATNITSSGGAINVASGVVESNLVKIDGTANASAHFQLGKLSVVNSGLFSGAAVVINNTGGTGTSYALQLVSSSAEALLASTSGTNKPSASFNGNGSGAGIISFGGASGPGIKFDGGGSAVSIDIADGITLTVDGKNIITLLGDIAGLLMGKSSVTTPVAGTKREVFRSVDDTRDVRTIDVNTTSKQRTASS